MPQEDDGGSQVNHSDEIVWVTFPADHDAAIVMQPREQAMPGLNGFQVAEKISAFAPSLPIILYTFYGFDAMNVEDKKHGITDVVDKADLGERLLEKIAQHLNQPKTSLLDLPAPAVSDAKEKEE